MGERKAFPPLRVPRAVTWLTVHRAPDIPNRHSGQDCSEPDNLFWNISAKKVLLLYIRKIFPEAQVRGRARRREIHSSVTDPTPRKVLRCDLIYRLRDNSGIPKPQSPYFRNSETPISLPTGKRAVNRAHSHCQPASPRPSGSHSTHPRPGGFSFSCLTGQNAESGGAQKSEM